MAAIKDLNMLLGLIGEGRAIRELNDLWPEAVKTLAALSRDQPKKSQKGSITLKISIDVKNGLAAVRLASEIKLPKREPEELVLWVEDKTGYFTDEHPKQINMFPDRNRTIEGSAVDTDEAAAAGGSAS